MEKEAFIAKLVGFGKELLKELTPEEKRLKEQIAEARAQIAEARSLIAKCEHSRVIKSPTDSAKCAICDKRFGWFCESSPDNVCHYFSDNGEIDLINGETVSLPESHDEGANPGWMGGLDDGESYDWCIFCGDPEERK